MSIEELLEYVTQAKAGDKSAFEKIYVSTYKEAYSIVYSIIDDKDSVEDVVHDIYIKVIVSIPKLNNEKSFKSWFKRIVVNTSKDFLLKKKPALFSSYDSNDGFEEDFDQRLVDEQSLSEPITSKPEIEEMSKRILKAIATLPKEQQICVMMHYYSEMTVDEIAEELGISRNTVLSRLSYARKKLKKELKDDRDNELFGIALFPFVQSIEIAPETLSAEVNGALLSELMASSEASALFSASSAGVFAKIAALSLAKKVLIGISAAAVLGGFAAFFIVNSQNNAALTEKAVRPAISVVANVTAPADAVETDAKDIHYSGGKMLLTMNGNVYYSADGGVYMADSNLGNRKKLAAGNACGFVSDGKYVYFVAEGKVFGYDTEKNKILLSNDTDGEYAVCSGDSIYTVSLKSKRIFKLNELLETEEETSVKGTNLRFCDNSLTFYRNKDLYYLDFKKGNLTPKRIINGGGLKGMKLKSQLLKGVVYYAGFDSDETGVINAATANGSSINGIKTKRGFVDFCVCNNSVLYSAVGGGIYKTDLAAASETLISEGEYSFTSYSAPYALCYNPGSDESLLINAESGEISKLTDGYADSFEYYSGHIFYRVNGNNHIKKL